MSEEGSHVSYRGGESCLPLSRGVEPKKDLTEFM